jgi:hypothetical protein
MEKRTTIYLDSEDLRAIEAIKADHAARGIKVTDASAVRYALRDTARRLGQLAKRRGDA